MTKIHPPCDQIFPALGFFGAHSNIQLKVAFGITVKAIRLTVAAEIPTFLNLQRVEIWVDGKLASLDPEEWSETLSSSHDAALEKAPRLLAGAGVHSASELRPYWTCEFNEPIKIDELRVSNRRDTWARRSQHLIVEAMLSDGRWLVLRRNHGADAVVGCLAELANQGIALSTASHGDLQSQRNDWVKQLNIKFSQGNNGSSFSPSWPQLLAMIPIWNNAPLIDSDLQLCAHFLLDQAQRGDDLAMSYLSAVLKTSEQIDRLTDCINEIAAKRGSERYMLTRHGLQRQGKLISHRDRFLSAAQKVIEVLDSEGLTPVLAYGTLLGAVRSQSFIAHDDDLDILCSVQASDSVTARAAMLKVIEALNKQGFEAKFSSPTALNVHAVDLSNGALIDVFPYWIVEEQAFLHMERMAVRAIPAAILSGRSQVNIYDHAFPAPADPDGFLLERYGVTWRVPLAHFEWPWPLDSVGNV